MLHLEREARDWSTYNEYSFRIILLLLYVYCSRAHPHFPSQFRRRRLQDFFTSSANSPKSWWEGNLLFMRKASKFFETYFRKHSNDTKKRKLKAEHPSDRTNKRAFTSCKKRRPRDVSLVSVVLGGSRGQVFVSRFAQLPFFATSTAFCCCHVRYDTRKVRYVADAIVASSRRP